MYVCNKQQKEQTQHAFSGPFHTGVGNQEEPWQKVGRYTNSPRTHTGNTL